MFVGSVIFVSCFDSLVALWFVGRLVSCCVVMFLIVCVCVFGGLVLLERWIIIGSSLGRC